MSKFRPVTNEEYVLPDGEVIITRTDPGSRIVYANQAFLTSSGFSLDECMGRPQNIVRHPDMPREAFADLWATIKAGRPWTGIVKNRRKNGGYYWVRANVTPIMEAGRITGYMSVRVKPTHREVEQAAMAYAAIRTGHGRQLAIREGQVVDAGLSGRLHAIARLSAHRAIWSGAVMLCGFFALVGIAAMDPAQSARTLLGTVAASGMAVTACLVRYLLRNVVAPVNVAFESAIAVVGGALDRSFPETGAPEVRRLLRTLNQMNAKLVGVLMDSRLGIDGVMTETREIAAGNADLALRAGQQAASLQETAASIEELTATVAQNTGNAEQANQLTRSAMEITMRGKAAVTQVVGSMELIQSSARRIADILAIIDGIAFQTNLLALNAAVEAARAGDQGRGFAVVAGEVRTLAQRSAVAAKEIKELIGSSLTQVEAGGRLADQAGATIDEVVTSVKRVTDLMGELLTASHEQSRGLEQIEQAIGEIDRITQQNAAMAQHVNSNVSVLEHQSRRVMDAIQAFNLERLLAGTKGRTRATADRADAERELALPSDEGLLQRA